MGFREIDFQYFVKDEVKDEVDNDVIVDDDYDNLNGFYMQVLKGVWYCLIV